MLPEDWGGVTSWFCETMGDYVDRVCISHPCCSWKRRVLMLDLIRR